MPRHSLRLAAPALAALVLGSAAPRTARAQDALDAKSAAYVRDQYLADLDTVHTKVMALAAAIPADKYAWRPVAGVRSVSEALMHVVGEWYFFTPMSVAAKPPADFGSPREKLPALEKITDKTQVMAELERSWAHCRAQLSTVDAAQLTGRYKPWDATLAQSAFVMSGDLHEHLGQLIVYARSVGVKPPWSK
ncbi:MAG: DinB family protein [Gemmatirosa sp.]|nr:DinB family protein [Gemmatirosa sp.]